MSNILLFFMSAYKPDIKNGAYSRAQTNETVLYELQKQKERRPDTVLALCSASVRNAASVPAPDGGASVTTLDYFRQQVLPAAGIPAGQLCLHPRARQHERGRPGQGHPGYCAEGSTR